MEKDSPEKQGQQTLRQAEERAKEIIQRARQEAQEIVAQARQRAQAQAEMRKQKGLAEIEAEANAAYQEGHREIEELKHRTQKGLKRASGFLIRLITGSVVEE